MTSATTLLKTLIMLWWLLSIYWYVCEINHNGCSCLSPKPQKQPISLQYDGKEIVKIDTAFVFPFMKAVPISTPKNWQILHEHLKNNPGQQLKITTFYTSQEARKMAIATERAAQILSLLQHQGISSNQIQVEVAEQKKPIIYENNCFNCIEMSLEKRILISNQDAQKLLNASTVIYFDKAQIKFQADSNTIASLQLIALYLQQEPHQKAIINAHTDEEGGEEANMALSEKRANAIKASLLQMQAPIEQIELAPKGKKLPQCTEKTPECYRKNRRAEILITNDKNN